MRRVRVYDIDWCVEDEDVTDQEEMEEILNKLPKTVILDIEEYPEVDFDNDEGMLEEAITETLMNRYGWLVYGYYYEEIKGGKR